MNCLYARANSKFHVVLSDKNCPNLFSSVKTDEITSIPYSYQSSLEEDEWFSYQFGEAEDIANETQKISDPLERLSRQIKTSLSTLSEKQYSMVKYLVYKPDGSNWFYIQKVMSKSKIYGKKVLTFSEQPEVVSKPFIIINEKPDALYNIKTNTLYFKKISQMNEIFANINLIYRNASEPEMQEFLALPLLNIQNNFKISLVNSKHIAVLLNEYNEYPDDVKENLHSYIENIQDLSKDDDGKYIIKDDKDLRKFIYALQERYYTTVATRQERIAKSYINK